MLQYYSYKFIFAILHSNSPQQVGPKELYTLHTLNWDVENYTYSVVDLFPPLQWMIMPGSIWLCVFVW